MRSVLLIDIPVVPVTLPEDARISVRRKLAVEAAVRHHLLPGVICPPIPYSRGLLIVATVLREAGFAVQYVVWSDPEDRRRVRELAADADAPTSRSRPPTARTVCTWRGTSARTRAAHLRVGVLRGRTARITLDRSCEPSRCSCLMSFSLSSVERPRRGG